MIKISSPDRILYYLLTVLISISYTCLRFTMNVEFNWATWKMLYDLTAAIPYGNRILVPLLSRPLVALGSDIRGAYMFWETAFGILLVYGLYNVFRLYMDEKWSRIFSLLFFLFLPMAFLLQFKYHILYPNDTPAMAFTVLALFLALKERWKLLVLLVAVATLNRESSVLIPLIFAAMYADKMGTKRFLLILASLSVAYIIVRLGIMELTRDNPHPYGGEMAFTYANKNSWRVNSNIAGLINNPMKPFILLATVDFTPFFIIMLRKRIPEHIMNLALVCGVYVFMLFFIGNIFEPRILGEVLAIAYVMVCLGTFSYLNETALSAPNNTLRSEAPTPLAPVAALVQRYGWYALAIASVSGFALLNVLGVKFFFR